MKIMRIYEKDAAWSARRLTLARLASLEFPPYVVERG